MKALSENSETGSAKEEHKPTYDVGYWEYVYELELKRYMEFLERKAKRLKALKKIDLFSIEEAEAKKANKQIHYLEEELNILYGTKLFMDEMKNCYLDSSCKIHDTFYQKNLDLEVENHKLREKLTELITQLKWKQSKTLY